MGANEKNGCCRPARLILSMKVLRRACQAGKRQSGAIWLIPAQIWGCRGTRALRLPFRIETGSDEAVGGDLRFQRLPIRQKGLDQILRIEGRVILCRPVQGGVQTIEGGGKQDGQLFNLWP